MTPAVTDTSRKMVRHLDVVKHVRRLKYLSLIRFNKAKQQHRERIQETFHIHAWMQGMLQSVLIYDMPETGLGNKMAPRKSSHLFSMSKNGRNICPNGIVV